MLTKVCEAGLPEPDAPTPSPESGAGDGVSMSIAGHVSRAILSRHSHVRIEAKRPGLDVIARQRILALVRSGMCFNPNLARHLQSLHLPTSLAAPSQVACGRRRPSPPTRIACSLETFTNADFLELETLGPLKRLRPGETVTHTERWTAHRGVHISKWDDAELDRVLAPLV